MIGLMCSGIASKLSTDRGWLRPRRGSSRPADPRSRSYPSSAPSFSIHLHQRRSLATAVLTARLNWGPVEKFEPRSRRSFFFLLFLLYAYSAGRDRVTVHEENGGVPGRVGGETISC